MLSDEILLQRWHAWQDNGENYSAAARALGVDEAQVRRSVAAATRRNLTNEWLGGKLPEGYLMGKVTSHVREDGSVKQEWQRMHPAIEHIQEVIDELIEAMAADITPLAATSQPTIATNDDWLTLYPIVDVHLGLYAWGKESGENYDLEIAKQQFLSSVTDLMQQSPYSDTALIVVLGDFFHADNNRAETERSHNHLDVDGRHDKVLHLGTELIIWMIDMALQKHQKVIVKVQRGNHDPYASKALGMALWFRYLDNPQVIIDRSPRDLWTYQWGKTMLSFTHGDNVKAENMPGVMASQEAVIWGNTIYRYGFSGHYHKARKGPLGDEKDGAIWEILPAFTAKDEWNFSMGHSSYRALVSKTFSRETGEKFTHKVNL